MTLFQEGLEGPDDLPLPVGRVFEVEARLVAVREALKGDEEGVDRDVAVHAASSRRAGTRVAVAGACATFLGSRRAITESSFARAKEGVRVRVRVRVAKRARRMAEKEVAGRSRNLNRSLDLSLSLGLWDQTRRERVG
jgi:hypothetical protein